MTRIDLTRTVKRRLDSYKSCPICNNKIKDNEDLVYTIKRKRRCKEYIFYHERCLINEEKKKESPG